MSSLRRSSLAFTPTLTLQERHPPTWAPRPARAPDISPLSGPTSARASTLPRPNPCLNTTPPQARASGGGVATLPRVRGAPGASLRAGQRPGLSAASSHSASGAPERSAVQRAPAAPRAIVSAAVVSSRRAFSPCSLVFSSFEQGSSNRSVVEVNIFRCG